MNTTIGSTFISKITNQADMDLLVKSLNLTSKNLIIKPNWVGGCLGEHTESKALDMFLTAINRPVTFIESYTFWRTDKMTRGEGDYFSSKEADIVEGKKHWDFFKQQDKLFLEVEGLDKLFKKHGANYINITNEVWSGNTVSPDTIKTEVTKKYSPLHFDKLYSYVPQALYNLKGSDLISFAKAKADKEYGPSLSIKNMFGLIPDPHRSVAGYHGGGDDEPNLVNAIVDIHKIYQSLFNLKFLIDGIFTSGFMNWDTFQVEPTLDQKLAIAGTNGHEVDNIGSHLLQIPFNGPMVPLMKEYSTLFGKNTITADQIPEDYKISLKL